MSIYRDPSAHLRESLQTLRQELAALVATLPPAFWEALPPHESAALRDEGARDPSPEALAQAHARARHRLDALRAHVAEIDALEQSWRAIADEAPAVAFPVDVPGVAPDDAAAARVTTVLRGALRDPAPDAVRVTAMAAGARAEFRHRGARFVYDAWRDDDGVGLAVHTAAPRGAPSLRVRPEGMLDSISRAFRHGLSMFGERFDAFFVVEGEPLAVSLLRQDPLRAALLDIAREDVPTLELTPGLACVRWRFEPGARSLAAAVTALHVARGCAVRPLRTT